MGLAQGRKKPQIPQHWEPPQAQVGLGGLGLCTLNKTLPLPNMHMPTLIYPETTKTNSTAFWSLTSVTPRIPDQIPTLPKTLVPIWLWRQRSNLPSLCPISFSSTARISHLADHSCGLVSMLVSLDLSRYFGPQILKTVPGTRQVLSWRQGLHAPPWQHTQPPSSFMLPTP